MFKSRTLVFALTTLLVGAAAAALTLDGGTECFTFPEDVTNKKASISLKNETRSKICDFVVKAAGNSSFKITSATINDDNQKGEKWVVDDDGDGTLEAGEDDTTANPASGKVRIEEKGKDHCIERGRTVSLDLEFDTNPQKGNDLKISPTSKNGGVIFVNSLPGCTVVQEADTLLASGEVGLLNLQSDALTSIALTTDPGVEVIWATSGSHGGHLDHESATFLLDEPAAKGEIVHLYYELSDFNQEGSTTTVCFGETLSPDAVDVLPLD